MCFKFSKISKHLLNESLIAKLSQSNRTGVASTRNSTPSSKNWESPIMFLVPTHTNRMAPLNARIAILLKLAFLYLQTLPCHENSWMKPSSLPHISLIFFQAVSSTTKHLQNGFGKPNQTMPPFEFLGVHVGPIFDPTTPENFPFAQNNVFSLVIVHNIKGSSA